MPRLHVLQRRAERRLDLLLQLDADYQQSGFNRQEALEYPIEAVFLEGFKTWENFIEDLFISHARYNDPVSGKRAYPYLQPKTESHALDLLKLEKDFMDWTTPDHIISRAEKCFRGNKIVTDPIKSHMQDLRDMKKIRNHIAHGSKETERLFKELCRKRLGMVASRAGRYLNATSPSGIQTYNVYYLDLLKSLVNQLTS